ncbi:paraquat-inducible protein A (plasmid) [Falsihalocynthiibacter sp. SS001]|uniref:paraquat-inducible protein A n=1 Tax=Falsihalocynthiibacter sp. SS001 TaxID=3349698 RepID=UPI0036D3A59A
MERAGPRDETLTARDVGVVACRRCTKVWPEGQETCGRCGARIIGRDPRSLQRVWAWWFAGLILYIPANVYPMLVTRTLLFDQENTIIGGTIDLMHHGSYVVALVILVASVMVPMGKFLSIAFLAISVHHRSVVPKGQRHMLFEVVEYIGRWSMIDVFVVAILSSLVQLNTIATINPGPASLFFALSVIFTMLSASNFDPRMIWDVEQKAHEERT